MQGIDIHKFIIRSGISIELHVITINEVNKLKNYSYCEFPKIDCDCSFFKSSPGAGKAKKSLNCRLAILGSVYLSRGTKALVLGMLGN